jgi:hypothetical protein
LAEQCVPGLYARRGKYNKAGWELKRGKERKGDKITSTSFDKSKDNGYNPVRRTLTRNRSSPAQSVAQLKFCMCADRPPESIKPHSTLLRAEDFPLLTLKTPLKRQKKKTGGLDSLVRGESNGFLHECRF